jgi:hypothetical protein
MTSAELAVSLYGWLDAYAPEVFAVCVCTPLASAGVCALVRQGRRFGPRGQWLGNSILWLTVSLLALELTVVAAARAVFDTDLTCAPVLLLAGPPLGAVIAIISMHWLYPLNPLAA